jgi:hypothetical protein
MAIRLMKVRAQPEDDWWGNVVSRIFPDSCTRDVFKMVPRVVEEVAAIAATKSNRALEERWRAAFEEEERRRAEGERRPAIEGKRGKALEQLSQLVEGLREDAGNDPPLRLACLPEWAADKLAAGLGSSCRRRCWKNASSKPACSGRKTSGAELALAWPPQFAFHLRQRRHRLRVRSPFRYAPWR